jgi:DNA-binding GntR family transcriptional regulator
VTVRHDTSRSAYLQVADDLRRQIAAGQLKPGDRIETNQKLAERYDVATMTIRSALDVLRGEGLIASQQGRGTFVASDATDAAPVEASTQDLLVQLAEIKEALKGVNARLDLLESRVRDEG